MVARAFERDSLFSLIAGPMVWVVHFLTLYIFTAIACARGFFHVEVLGLRIVLLVGGILTLIALVLILDAAVISWRRWRSEPPEGGEAPLPPHDETDTDSRQRFMAYAGLLLSGISLVATMFETLPILIFTSCR
jgi:hypothetical protein